MSAQSAYPELSLRQACSMMNISTSVFRYRPIIRNEDALYRDKLLKMAETRPSWGFWKMYHKIRLEGHTINHKRLYRIYTASKLSMRRKSRKRLPKRIREPLLQPLCPNLTWSMDFMRDSLFQGKPFRAFNVIDDFNREALNITIAKSITSTRVISELEDLISWRGKPSAIRVDNGPEFIAQKLELWTQEQQIELKFIEKGKPNQNGFIERFNRTFREDVLDAHVFDSPAQAQKFSNQWIWRYNNERPHESLANLPPTTFLLKYGKLHVHPQGQTEFPTFQQDHDDHVHSMETSIFECS